MSISSLIIIIIIIIIINNDEDKQVWGVRQPYPPALEVIFTHNTGCSKKCNIAL